MSHPRRVEMMHRHGTLLGIHTRAEHGSGAEEHAHPPIVHRLDDRPLRLLVLELLYETYLVRKDAVVLHQLALDFRVDTPLSGLVGAQVRKDELCTLLCIVPVIIFSYHFCAVGSLIVGMVAVGRIDHAHIERHFPRVVGGDEHLCLFFCFRELFPSQYRGIARLGKLHELADEDFLVGRGRDVVQYLSLVGTDNAHILRCTVICNLIIKVMGMNVIS